MTTVSEIIINSQDLLDDHIDKLKLSFAKHKYLRATVKTGKQRTLTQNACLHLYCQQVADALNDAGLDIRTTVKSDVDVPWTDRLVKDTMWRAIQKAITGQDSTTKPETHQYSEIYDVLNRHLINKLGISVAWPSKETMNDGK